MTRTAVLYISDYQSDEVSGPAAITRQRIICAQTINTRGWRLIKEYIEDTVIDKNATPIKLFEAIDYCQANESILVFAELNLWAHNIGFTSKVLSSEIDVYFCDMPFVDAKILEILARVAQYERGLISRRTKAALAAKKQRGERWNIEANMEAISKAARAAGAARRERALHNPANVFFWRFIQNWEARNGKITANTDFTPIADELRTLGQTTATGLEYTSKRARAMYDKLKRIHESYHFLQKDNPSKKQIDHKDASDTTKVIINPEKLRIFEQQTKEAQELLSDIFVEDEDQQLADPSSNKPAGAWVDILKLLLTKEIWNRADIEQECRKRGVMLGAVLEQINDFAYSRVDDAVVEDDGEKLYITLAYKEQLI